MVTTNSASLVNKGLEVIEAHLLFDIPLERIDVVVHPQSVVHSMVQFVDGSTHRPGLAAGHAPAHRARPRLAGPGARRRHGLRLDAGHQLDVRAARRRRRSPPSAGQRRGAAGEHLPGRLQRRQRGSRDGLPRRAGSGFTDIVDTIEAVSANTQATSGLTVESVLDAETWARARTHERLAVRQRLGGQQDHTDEPVLLFILGVVFVAIGVAVSIALHEVGHLLPAKLFKVRVTKYMIGFGPTVWSKSAARPSTASRPSRWAATSP